MTARLTLRRVVAWFGVELCEKWAVKGGRSGGWPDKSAAVGVGAGDWNKTIISAIARISLLAPQSISAMFSKKSAPSAADGFEAAALP